MRDFFGELPTASQCAYILGGFADSKAPTRTEETHNLFLVRNLWQIRCAALSRLQDVEGAPADTSVSSSSATQRILDAFFRQQIADAFYNPVVSSDVVSAASSDEETVTDVDSVVSSVSSTVSDSVSSPAHVASVTRQRSIFEYFPRYSQARSVQSPDCAGVEAHGSNATPR